MKKFWLSDTSPIVTFTLGHAPRLLLRPSNHGFSLLVIAEIRWYLLYGGVFFSLYILTIVVHPSYHMYYPLRGACWRVMCATYTFVPFRTCILYIKGRGDSSSISELIPYIVCLTCFLSLSIFPHFAFYSHTHPISLKLHFQKTTSS